MAPATTLLSSEEISVDNDLTMEMGGCLLGFRDMMRTELHCGLQYSYTEAHFGSVGTFHVPFFAWVGWAIVICVAYSLAIIAARVIGRRRLLNSHGQK